MQGKHFALYWIEGDFNPFHFHPYNMGYRNHPLQPILWVNGAKTPSHGIFYPRTALTVVAMNDVPLEKILSEAAAKIVDQESPTTRGTRSDDLERDHHR